MMSRSAQETERQKIWIGNLHPSTTEKDLLVTFRRYGPILSVNYVWHTTGPLKGKPRGYAFIEYENIESVDNALRDNGNVRIKGNLIQIKQEERNPRNETNRNPYSILRKRTRGNEEIDRRNDCKGKMKENDQIQVSKAVKSIDDRIARLKVRIIHKSLVDSFDLIIDRVCRSNLRQQLHLHLQ